MTRARRGGDRIRREREPQIASDGEERPLDAEPREQLAEARRRHLGNGAQRALVQRLRIDSVDRRVAGEPVEIDRDARDHRVRRDSSCR